MKRALLGALALSFLLTDAAHADLHASRDVDRVLAQLEDGASSQGRAAAALWLMTHGPREVTVPHLLDALERETSPDALGPITHAIARLAGPEHDARLIRIAPTIRSPFRGVLVTLIAQLGTEASDAFLAQELAAMGAVEIEVAPARLTRGASAGTERVSLIALARARRDAVVPLLLREATPPRMAPVEALVHLAHEDARALYVSLLDDPALSPLAIEGLAALRPDAATADQLRAHVHEPVSPGLARALYAADPNAPELEAWRSEGPDDVQRTLRARLIADDPTRLSAREILAHVEDDASAWRASFSSPRREALTAYALLMHSDALPAEIRQASFDAALVLAGSDTALCSDLQPRLEGTAALVAAARQARTCRTPWSPPHDLSPTAALYLRALAGEDVRGAIDGAGRDASSYPDRRMDLAHAYWVSREAGRNLADAWAHEPDDDVRDVLSLAVQRHRVPVSTSLLAARLEAPRTRFSSVLVAGAQASLHPLTRPLLLRALHDASPRIRAAALVALARFEAPRHVMPWACAALEGDEAERAAARAVLAPNALCLQQAARVDASLREEHTSGGGGRDAVIFVEDNARLLFTGMDGTYGMAQPTSLGVVVIPDVRAAMRVVPALF